MNKSFVLGITLVLALGAVVVAGCGKQDKTDEASLATVETAVEAKEAIEMDEAVVVKDPVGLTSEFLAGKKFILSSVNGSVFVGERVPTLEFGESMQVSGQICNRFNGQGQLTDGLLTVSPLASTRMACPPGPLGELERDLFSFLESGVKLSPDGSGLVLEQGETILKYKAVQPEVGTAD